MALIQSVTVGDRIIDLHQFSGEVMEEKKWATTQVTSAGGGYNVNTGQNNPVTISSINRTHDQFFLKSDTGQEMAVELTDAGLALRKGHRVTVFWGIIHGQANGKYVAIYNHTTNSLTKMDDAINGLAMKPASGLVSLAFIASIFGICLYGLGFIGLVVLYIFWRIRKQRNLELVAILQAALDGAIAEAKAAKVA